jgi:hypothetical protein
MAPPSLISPPLVTGGKNEERNSNNLHIKKVIRVKDK